MISSTSSFASSMPATSAKVTLFWCSPSSLALDLPKLIALPPPAWSWRMNRKKMTTSASIGSHEPSSSVQQRVLVLLLELVLHRRLAVLARVVELVEQLGSDGRGADGAKFLGVAVLARPVLSLDRDLLDVRRVVLHLLHEGAERDLLVGSLGGPGEQLVDAHEHQDEQQPEQDGLMGLTQSDLACQLALLHTNAGNPHHSLTARQHRQARALGTRHLGVDEHVGHFAVARAIAGPHAAQRQRLATQ